MVPIPTSRMSGKATPQKSVAGSRRNSSEDPEDLAFLDGEGDVVDRDGVPVSLVEPFDFMTRMPRSLAARRRFVIGRPVRPRVGSTVGSPIHRTVDGVHRAA